MLSNFIFSFSVKKGDGFVDWSVKFPFKAALTVHQIISDMIAANPEYTKWMSRQLEENIFAGFFSFVSFLSNLVSFL